MLRQHESSEEKIMNFEQARQLAIQGINDYFMGQGSIGDRYGQWHGKKGKNRAEHLREYLISLSKPTSNKDASLLAVFLAVFGPPTTDRFFEMVPGRSSKLASLIADNWIRGDITYAHYIDDPGSVTSIVFSQESLNQVVNNSQNNRSVPAEYAGYSYFDHTKASRELLNMVLNSPTFQSCKNQIIKSAFRLSTHLEIDNSKFWVALSLLPLSQSRERAFIEGATIGALLSNQNPALDGNKPKTKPKKSWASLFRRSDMSHSPALQQADNFSIEMAEVKHQDNLTTLCSAAKLPAETVGHVSLWLTRADASQLVRVKKGSFQNAKYLEQQQEEEEQRLKLR